VAYFAAFARRFAGSDARVCQSPQKALGHIAPIQALKNWQETHPEWFGNNVYNLAGLGT
jgi:hypothetical protein